jgi:hypothetical protein
MKGKRVSMTEKSSVECTEMTGWDRAATGEEPVGESAKSKHLKGPPMDRKCTRLGHALGAPLEHCDINLRQRELAGEPQPNRATANDHNIEFLVHAEYSYSAAMTRWPAGSGMAEKVLSGS